MADESLHGPRSAFDLAKVAGVDVFAVKTEQSGGLYAAQRVAAIADAAGIELYGGTMLEGAVGTIAAAHVFATFANLQRSEEHTSELQSLMRISYAVFCLKKKTTT